MVLHCMGVLIVRKKLYHLENFVVILIINLKLILNFFEAKKLYGDHCQVDSDCSSKLNYECQNGVCNCTSTSYYESASEGCG
jgi:hypothetical protein